MRNEMIRSEKYRKYCTENTKNQLTFFIERTLKTARQTRTVQGCLDVATTKEINLRMGGGGMVRKLLLCEHCVSVV